MPSKAEILESLRDSIEEVESRSRTAPSARKVIRAGGDAHDAFSVVVRLAAARDRSTAELRKRLKDEGFDECEIDEALNRATACNLVDDVRFADARIRFLVRKGKGAAGIRRDLAAYGVDVSDVPGWPHDYVDVSSEGEFSRALALLERHPSRSRNLLRGSYQKLVRNGYTSDVAMKAAYAVANR